MKTVYGVYDEVNSARGTAITIGNFDGLHKGHLALLSALKKIAIDENLNALVYTFESHPKNYLFNKPKKNLTNIIYKENILSSLKIDTLFMESFARVKDLSAEEFVKTVLVQKLNVKHAVVGENNRFGKGALGDANLLKQLGKMYGFSVTVVPPCVIDGEVCSSTGVRALIEQGAVEKASDLLGRCFSVSSEVIHGKGLGKTYGYPTLNMSPSDDAVLPKDGVYATYAIIDDMTYKAITNVGKTSFDNETKNRIETHVLDFDGDVYGKTVEVAFIKRMRDFVPFNNISELENQLTKDKENRLNITEGNV